VNYTPLYYLINGLAFDKTNPLTSLFPAGPPSGLAGTVLVRLVNAGLRMHVPSIVGAQTGAAVSGFGLIAEDGNPLPGVTRVQNEVFMAPGKTYDVMINVPTAVGTALPIFDRQGSLSGNATSRDAGMLAYISINGAGLPAASALGAAVANPDTYNAVITGKTLTVSDPAKGLIANDFNVFGVQVSGTAPAGLTLNANGTFSYTGAPTAFTYCANGTTTTCASVTLGAATFEAASGITCTVPPYTSNVATTLSIKPPGVLAFCKDAAGYPLTVAASPAPALAGGTVAMDENGGFTATVAASGSHTLTFSPQNSQGTTIGSPATATLIFPARSNLHVTLVDGVTKAALSSPQDYRWIIEEEPHFLCRPQLAKPTPCRRPAL